MTVVSQEKKLVDTFTTKITVPTINGQITLLPKHIPLFTKVETGEIIYEDDSGKEHYMACSQGLLTVSPRGEVTIMVDSATLEREISAKKAEEAIKAAKETIRKSRDQRELMMAEASLKKAMLELRIAQKTKKQKV